MIKKSENSCNFSFLLFLNIKELVVKEMKKMNIEKEKIKENINFLLKLFKCEKFSFFDQNVMGYKRLCTC